MGKYVAHPDAEDAAFEALSAGGSREDARVELEARFPELKGWQRSGAIAVGIARLIRSFGTEQIEPHLEFPTDEELSRMTPQARKRSEARLERVWQAFDSLTDEDSGPREIIDAAKKLDKMLSLGWKERLPVGCFERAKTANN